MTTPNAWELERLTGHPARDPNAAVLAARKLGRPTLVSSVDRGGDIGVVYADRNEAWLAAHVRAATAPRGSGDLLAALFAASLLEGQTPAYALSRSVGGVAETIFAAAAWESRELPVAAMGARIKAASSDVRIEKLA